ncbi:MAG: penicillin-binding protein 2 [Clostridiales bacterium]|nr:penicillin-binding protein 2 [Clostridiales bacterium]
MNNMNENFQKEQKKSILRVIYVFVGLFILTIIYFTHFILVKSGDVINNAYNRRQGVLEEKVIRGNILSSKGEILARTAIDKEGNEKREYPYGDMFAHVVGRYTRGISGIEEAENIRLLTSDINSIEKIVYELSGQKNLGNNVITSLDVQLQKIAYESLGNNRGAVVVMEPNSGRILAMVSKPAYDPNKIDSTWDEVSSNEDESPLINRATQGLYAPGSTFKIMTSLALMRQDPEYENYEYYCDSSIKYENMVIRCAGKVAHGKVDLVKSLAKSCNTSFVNIGNSLDINQFRILCEEFLFNKNLPISMASSPSSFKLNSESGQKELMQTSIGMGKTLITPLHNAMIISTIANKGSMMKPQVVLRVENADGHTIKRYTTQSIGNLMTLEEADYLAQMLRSVVEDGTAKELKDLPFQVAGKTGSAEQEGKAPHAWFVGYAPYDNPRIAVSIIVESVGTGSDYAVPIAKKLFQAYLDSENNGGF